ncbi:hypothetical protein [Streptomyces rubiginosohelvolus]
MDHSDNVAEREKADDRGVDDVAVSFQLQIGDVLVLPIDLLNVAVSETREDQVLASLD